jgi:ferric-dicitrate binding protein FerR (iron transport regulator)
MDQEELLAKISKGTASEGEIALYNSYCIATEKAAMASGALPDEDGVEEQMRQEIQRRITIKKQPILLKYWYLAAAVLTGIVVAGFLLYQPATLQHTATIAPVQEIPAGSDKAVLTLANGKQILLNDADSGDIARQAGLRIYKTATGEIVYEATGNSTDTGSNHIATPRGGQYRIVLQDGTKVWLNAASSLTYPAVFATAERKVTLSGEAYFEVAKDAGKPFKVITATQTIDVLGTNFNVNAYNDNSLVSTTLLEGSVRITAAASTQRTILKPGEQARLNNQTGTLLKSSVNEMDAVAWKNGFFVFNDTYLTEVLLQLSRWYDVQIDPATIPKIRYTGVIPRDQPLSKVLDMLEFTGDQQFYMEHKTIKIRK